MIVHPSTSGMASQSPETRPTHSRKSSTTFTADTPPPWHPGPHRTYLLSNANIVDPATGTVLPSRNVTISSGKITQIASSSSSPSSFSSSSPPSPTSPSTITTIDLTGKFLLPGLIDSHVHFAAVPGESTLHDLFALDPTLTTLRQPWVAAQMLARGFTTVRDCGGATLALKESLAAHIFAGPRLFIAGQALSQTGGHADRRGAHDHSAACCSGMGGRVVDGTAACLAAAREELRTGADFLKVMAGGGVSSPTDAVEHLQFTAEEMRAITEVARGVGTYVTAHAYTPKSIRHALENGVRGIEHGNLLDIPTAQEMARLGAWLTPTLPTYAAMAESQFAHFLPPSARLKNSEVLKAGVESVRIAREAGVRLCYGTDLLGAMGVRQLDGVRLLAGVLDSEEVLRTLTVNPAEMLGLGEEVGQVKVGFRADLLVLNRDPLRDVMVLAKPEENLLVVMKDGRVEVSRWSMLPVDTVPPEVLIE